MKEPRNKMQSLNDYVEHEIYKMRKFRKEYTAHNQQHGDELMPMHMEQKEWHEQYCLWHQADELTAQELPNEQDQRSSRADTERTSSAGDKSR